MAQEFNMENLLSCFGYFFLKLNCEETRNVDSRAFIVLFIHSCQKRSLNSLHDPALLLQYINKYKKLLTLALGLLQSSSNPGLRMHHSLVQPLSVPRTFSQSAKTIMLWSLKVRFCQKVLIFLSYLQTDKHFTFLNLKI